MAFSTDIVCPSNVLIQLPSLTAHSLRVVSAEAVRTHWRERGERGIGREVGERRKEEEKIERGKEGEIRWQGGKGAREKRVSAK